MRQLSNVSYPIQYFAEYLLLRLAQETSLKQSKRDHIPDSLSREQLCGEWPKHSKAPEGQAKTNQLLALREGEPQLSSPYSKTISRPDGRLDEPRISVSHQAPISPHPLQTWPTAAQVDPVRFPTGPPQTRYDLSSQTPYSPLRSSKEPEYKSRWPINAKDTSSVDSPVDPQLSFSRILVRCSILGQPCQPDVSTEHRKAQIGLVP